jgi:hypothetical protein
LDPSRKGGVRFLGPLCLLAALALSAHCGWIREKEDFRLQGTLESPEAVASAVITGMAAGNLGELKHLAVTEVEFRELVWPMLPASRPERNLPMEYVWGDLAAKSDANLRARLAGWQDRGFVLVSLSFKGGTEDYGTFKVHRETVLVLRDRDGREQNGRLFGSIIEHKGRFKVFSYVVD